MKKIFQKTIYFLTPKYSWVFPILVLGMAGYIYYMPSDRFENQSQKSQLALNLTTSETAQKSIQDINNSLNESEKILFKEALKYHTIDTYIDPVLDGKTAFNIISAYTFQQENKRNQKKSEVLSLEEQVNDLNFQRERATDSYNELIGLVLNDSKLVKTENDDGSITDFIQVIARNELKIPISSIVFRLQIKSPERPVPWVDEQITYQIPGGLETNEEKILNIENHNFQEWIKIEFPNDANFEIQVMKVAGSDGKIALPTHEFTNEDQIKLDFLTQKLEEKQKN